MERAGDARAHLDFLNERWERTGLSEGRARLIGETREGTVADCILYRENPGDTTLVGPVIERVVGERGLPVRNAWGDRGLFSKANEARLRGRGIRSGLCPRDVNDLADRLADE